MIGCFSELILETVMMTLLVCEFCASRGLRVGIGMEVDVL